MVSWKAFPSLPPRASPRVSLAPKTPFPFLSNASHEGYDLYKTTYVVCKISPMGI